MSSLNMIFLKIITGLRHYLKREESVPFEAWIRKVAIRAIIDEFRKERKYRETISLGDGMRDEDEPSDQQTWSRYDEDEILFAIDTLPPMSRTVFNLFAIDGYRHDEISELQGISTGTSKAHLFKARKKLQEILLSAPRVRKQ